jgi:hypothetical protein
MILSAEVSFVMWMAIYPWDEGDFISPADAQRFKSEYYV